MTEYFAFIGKNVSTGEPNPTTGRMSHWGEYKYFSSKAEAQAYVDNNRNPYLTDVCEVGTRRTLRKYDLGSTVSAYNEHLDWVTLAD